MTRRLWTDEMDALLLRLIANGLSYSWVAIRLNEAFNTQSTRNSVASRLRSLRRGQGRSTKAVAPPPAKPRAPPPTIRNEPPAPDCPPVTLAERGPAQCYWPISNEPPHLFCGAPKAEFDRTYCPYHRWLATPPSARHRLGAGTP